MLLSIVILSFNTPELLLGCLDSLKKQFVDELNRGDIEIIVVDNASKLEIVEEISKKIVGFPDLTLIKNEENLGFGKGCNIGASHAKGEFILFLNSDTQVNDRGILGMVSFLKTRPEVGILGGKLINPDTSPQASSGKFYSLLTFFITFLGGERFGLLRKSYEKITRVDWVSGACMMVPKKTFDKIGGFDKNMFMYIEDMEISYRAKKKGFLTYYFPSVSIVHRSQGSSNRSFAVYNIYKGTLYFFKKHKSTPQYQVVRFVLRGKSAIIYILGKLTKNNYYISTYGKTFELF